MAPNIGAKPAVIQLVRLQSESDPSATSVPKPSLSQELKGSTTSINPYVAIAIAIAPMYYKTLVILRRQIMH